MIRASLRKWRRRSPGTASSLLVSSLGGEGGVYVLEGGGFAAIDGMSTTGLAVSADRRRLARLPWSDDESERPGELMIYDEAGVAARHVLDDLREPHGALWSGETLMVVSTATNAVLRIGATGALEGRWRAPGRGDCWHLNSLTSLGARTLVSAFGRFSEHHAWGSSSARRGTGVVIELGSGREVLSGLSAPHNPLWLDGSWLICNSDEGAVMRLDRHGEVAGRRCFAGWTRGLACDEAHVYVGVSAHRLRGAEAGSAFVAAMTRDRLELVQTWSIPCPEIYDVAWAPASLVAGLRRAHSSAWHPRVARVA